MSDNIKYIDCCGNVSTRPLKVVVLDMVPVTFSNYLK